MTVKKPRGFAAMTPERRREIASRGGSSVAPEKRGWAKDPEAAREAGRKGGQISSRKKQK